MLPDYRVRQREYLLEISRALTEELDLNTLLSRILQISIEMLSGHAGFIALTDEHRGWHLAVSKGIQPALAEHIESWLQQQSENESDSEANIPEINKMLNDISMGLISGVGISMLVQKKPIGQIFVFRNYRGVFTSNDYSILNNFANQAAIAVRNARLYNEIREQNMRITALLASVADGILILTPDLRVQSANRSMTRLLNCSSMELIGQKYEDVVRWKGEPTGLKLEDLTVSGWKDYAPGEMFLEGNLVRREGMECTPVAITYAPLFSNEGRLLNIIASVRDISRYREAEEIKSNFISVISHELKTPIALIKGYASTLRRKDVDWEPEMIQESLEVIEEEADHLANMVDDLLDATRLQSGDVAVKKTEIDLVGLVRQQVKRFLPELEGHQISVDFPEDFPLIVADEGRINQLISNLLINATKYTDSGEIRIVGLVTGEFVQICISDEGKGFDPKDVPFLFDRFYRSDRDSKTSKGTGLGLFLCKAIVTAHNGTIWVDESYKQGAKICFRLPIHADIQA
ncbi:MAG: PAS domain-containing protein [Chloroflexi bacterium]|jgi:K+-sensing histidine kinase KdpD|nr:PAS domain-containing protein [Chloroflexota bacterium]